MSSAKGLFEKDLTGPLKWYGSRISGKVVEKGSHFYFLAAEGYIMGIVKPSCNYNNLNITQTKQKNLFHLGIVFYACLGGSGDSSSSNSSTSGTVTINVTDAKPVPPSDTKQVLITMSSFFIEI